MKIGYLISNYFPSVGGAQACVHHLASRIIDRGHRVVVVTPARGGRDDKFFKYKIIKLNPLLNRLLFIDFSLGKKYLEGVLSRIQKRYNFDIWQVTIGYPLGVASVDFFNRHRIPCILRCSGEDIQVLPELGYGYRLNRRTDTLIRENYQKFTALIIAGEATKRYYLSLDVPKDKIFIIPNGVNTSKFDMVVDREAVRRELGVKDNQKLIITVGRNHPKKGFKYIPQIIKMLKKNGTQFKWLLVGKDCERIKSLAAIEGVGEYLIVREASTGISNAGEPEVPNNILIRYYKTADIFVFPTLIELFAMVLIEAMAAGLPIVTTDVPGADEIIQDNENGLKNKKGDIAGMSESILRLFSDRTLAKRLSDNALRDAKNYDWSRIAGMYIDLYKRISANKTP